MTTLWRIAGMLALATGLIMLINSCSVDSAAAALRTADLAQTDASLFSPHLSSGQDRIGSATAELQPNFDARPLQFKDGTSLEVETLATG